VIIEVTFSGQGADDYLADRENTGAPLYTLAPSRFDMLDLIASATEDAQVSSFTGTIVRGHFERENAPSGRPLVQPFGIEWAQLPNEVQVDVTRVIYAHEFSFHPAPLAQLEYLLFGAGDDLFLAHRITMPDDFDQLLPTRIDGHTFTDQKLQRGIIITVPDRPNTLSARLMEGDTVAVEARAAATGILLAAGVQIAAGQEFYFEEGELHYPADFDPTEAEIDGGFDFPEKSA
jgi:hypothetical protein